MEVSISANDHARLENSVQRKHVAFSQLLVYHETVHVMDKFPSTGTKDQFLKTRSNGADLENSISLPIVSLLRLL